MNKEQKTFKKQNKLRARRARRVKTLVATRNSTRKKINSSKIKYKIDKKKASEMNVETMLQRRKNLIAILSLQLEDATQYSIHALEAMLSELERRHSKNPGVLERHLQK